MTAQRKQEAVLWVLRETAADLSAWREVFLKYGAVSLKSRPQGGREGRIAQLQAKLGAVTMDASCSTRRSHA